MKTAKRLIVCGLLLAVGVAGCSGDEGPSVPRGAGLDAANQANLKSETGKTKKSARLSSAVD